ncbi:Intraflagellar transport protein 20-like protein [Operophtera brumata]|uniref:Intraflagellar transport protein 20-like protein n=1 Tax=Operophtera brumata TaxID=104452 RepID=A0A0L7KXR6_OPEBR|nr:Intraflagellar transport protein 20-like protein [Operophtera brumata]
MAEELQKVHLYYDEINKVRILETNVIKETEDLRDTCKDYDTKINDKTLILEQLDSEYDALQILEATQMETIEYLTQLR